MPTLNDEILDCMAQRYAVPTSNGAQLGVCDAPFAEGWSSSHPRAIAASALSSIRCFWERQRSFLFPLPINARSGHAKLCVSKRGRRARIQADIAASW